MRAVEVTDKDRQGRRPVLPRRFRARPASVRARGRTPIAASGSSRRRSIVLSSNNNNFAKGAPGEPILISLDDAADAVPRVRPRDPRAAPERLPIRGSRGTPRDFVEYPSQVNEHWLLTRDVLDKYRAALPDQASRCRRRWSTRSRSRATFNQGFATVGISVVGDRRHEAPHRARRRDRSRRVRDARRSPRSACRRRS